VSLKHSDLEPENPMDQPAVRRVAVLYHPKKDATRPVADEIAGWLNGCGLESWLGSTWDEEAVRARIPELDLIIVLGGDGSMLRAARMAAGHSTLLLGVNMGRLGFLSEMTPETWREVLPRVVSRQFWVEQRMMLKARSWRGDRLLGEYLALNDVVVSRGSLARVVRLETEIDDDQLTMYIADGLVISTPTGSTAYSLAAGGPILPPELHNILIIPIAPHLSLNRPIVVAEGSVIRVTVGTDHQAILTVDGQFEFEMQNGDRVEVSASDGASHFVRLGKRTYFYHRLLERLGIKQVYDPNGQG
jgi:NAD+ kinase